MKFIKDYSLSKLTTFRIGGKVDYFAKVRSRSDLFESVEFARKKSLPIFVIGEGSNVLVSDKKFGGLVIHLINKEVTFEEEIVTSGGGTKWDDLVAYCVKRNLQGVECLSGIPGTVGAAPVQNIGAYGQELKDTFYELTALDLIKGKFVVLGKRECRFGYRDSLFKRPQFKNRYIIFEVKLKLTLNGKPTLTYQSLTDYLGKNEIVNPTLRQVRDSVIQIREQKLPSPSKIGSAGSFFKNPILNKKEVVKLESKFKGIPVFEMNGYMKVPAGWLIDQAGWKGRKYKNAGVFESNALVLTNATGHASAEEISKLAQMIQKDVYEKYGIKLEPEVNYVNF